MYSVIQNLVQNVIKHGVFGKFLKISLLNNCKIVIIRVEDHGHGIPKKEQKKIFEPFIKGEFSIANQIDGSGIGLNLVKKF